MFETTKTVREYALEIPGATRIFENLGIDYCCRGGKSLADACATAGGPLDNVLDSLVTNARSYETFGDQKWYSASQAELIAHIVEKHHAFTREELERLETLLTKVCGVHGQYHPELFHVQDQFGKLRAEVEPHMSKEERVLFPYIVRMEEAAVMNQPLPAPPFGTVISAQTIGPAIQFMAGKTGQQLGNQRRPAQFLLPDSALKNLLACEYFTVPNGLLPLSVFTPNDFETATRRTFAVAVLSDLHSNYFG